MTTSVLVIGSMAALILAIFFLRIPIGMLLVLLGFCGYAMVDGLSYAASMLGNEFWSTFSNPGFTVIPLFVLMGQICYHSGLSGRLYKAVASLAGHYPGGVAGATILACGGFSAICGSNTATAATMSIVSLPEMRKYGYEPSFAAGVIATGTTLGAVIPPSVVAIILGIETGLSIRKLFMGGIMPGLLLLSLFLAVIFLLARRRPDLAPAGARASWGERLRNLPGLLEALLLFGLVVGGLSAGAFTPTEAGAAGTALALSMGVARRSLSLKGLGRALLESLNVSAMIFLLLAGASCFGRFLAVSRAPFMVAQWVEALPLPPLMIMLIILFIYLVGGMLMDAMALLLITLPIFFPLISELGYDPLWFCLVLLVVTTLGAITPPVGASAYVVAAMGKLPLGGVFRGTVLFMPAFLICVLLMFLFPNLFLWLPNIVS